MKHVLSMSLLSDACLYYVLLFVCTKDTAGTEALDIGCRDCSSPSSSSICSSLIGTGRWQGVVFMVGVVRWGGGEAKFITIVISSESYRCEVPLLSVLNPTDVKCLYSDSETRE